MSEQGLTQAEEKAILTLVLMAVFADDRHDPKERAELNRIISTLSKEGELDVAAVYQDVVLKRVTVTTTSTLLTSPEAKRLAYELCVGVCSADDAQNEAERAFLASLATALGVPPSLGSATTGLAASADSLATASLGTVSAAEPVVTTLTSSLSQADIDSLILNYAILNGALELLPDSLASMAIIPLQMKMVYRIGHSFGFELDRAHIKDFAATAGVGLASQYVEQIGTKLVGHLFGRGLLGSLFRGTARQSVSSGFSFVTTHALGRLATRYYGSGRTLSTDMLRKTYEGLLEEAKGLQGQYGDAIRTRAQSVDVARLVKDVTSTT